MELIRGPWRQVRLMTRRIGRPYLTWRERRQYHPSFEPYQVRGHMPRPGAPRVLHAIASFGIGGSGQLIVDLVEGLGESIDQHVIVCSLPRVRAYAGIKAEEYRYLTSPRPIVRAIERLRPDVIHLHNIADHREPWLESYEWYLHVLAAAETTGIPVVENVNIPTEPFRSAAVAEYVYVSNYVRELYARQGERATVIYPGSDLNLFRRPGGSRRAGGVLGLVYRLEDDKLNEAAILPMIRVLQQREWAEGLVVGGGGYLTEFRRRAKLAGVSDRVRFTRYVPYRQLRSLYQEMALFVAPVHSESFGQVSVFAMGMELPVAGYDVGALGEILGDPDVLAPQGEFETLAAILIELLEDRARANAIGRRNRLVAEEKFSVQAMVQRYASLYGAVA